MVVAIHCELFPMVLFPWLQVAVPLFFMISSYIFFTRLQLIDKEKQSEATKKYITSNLKYYFFWFLLLLPVTIVIRRNWYDNERVLRSIIKICSQTLFSSTFAASWFIIAAVWGIFILSKLKNVSKKIMIPLIILIYCICCIRSSYYNFFKEIPVIKLCVKAYEAIFCRPYYSFPIALCWMYVGKLFAETEKTRKMLTFSLVGGVVFAIMLFMEWKCVYLLSGKILHDCYLMLMPLCICLFGIILNTKLNIKHALVLRTISTIMYPLHVSLMRIVEFVFGKLSINNILLLYITVVLICHLATLIIVKFEKTKYGGFLKYSH